MKQHFLKLFEHEHWANLKVLEKVIAIENPPQKAIELLSHIIAVQRIWLDRINGKKNQVGVWEVFEVEILLELLEINYEEMCSLIEADDLERLISYKNSKGVAYVNTTNQILTHLTLHAAYHRGQIVTTIKPFTDDLPVTDFVFYVR
jgi:uncharacterized damage-inducible protein DinB